MAETRTAFIDVNSMNMRRPLHIMSTAENFPQANEAM